MKSPASHRFLTRRHVLGLGILVVVCAVLIAALVYARSGDGRTRIAAEFTSATGIYPGDDVKVLGVRVGTIDSVTPGPESVRIVMHVDDDVPVPADAQALIVSQSLVAARFVQFTPPYDDGPRLKDGDTIPLERTGVPVEWDDITASLAQLTDALGPEGADESGDQTGSDSPGGPERSGNPSDPGSLASVITDAAEMVDGNGAQFKKAMVQLSDAMSTLANGREDIFSIVRNLQVFVSALKSSSQQITSFNQNLAGVTGVLEDNRDLLGSALGTLDSALGDVQGFVDENGKLLTDNIAEIGDVTDVLTDQQSSLEEILHQAPTQMANFYNIYKPAQGSMTGVISVPNMANPIQFICGSIAGAERANSAEASRLCKEYLGPFLSTLRMNYPDVLINPVTGVFADPGQVEYSQPGLQETVPDLVPAAPPAPAEAGKPDTAAVPSVHELMMGGAPR